MNSGIAKKIKKYAKKNYRLDFNNAVRLLSGLELRYRIKYAFGIILKKYNAPEIKSGVKNV